MDITQELYDRLNEIGPKFLNAEMMQAESKALGLTYESGFYGGCYQAFKNEIEFLTEILKRVSVTAEAGPHSGD